MTKRMTAITATLLVVCALQDARAGQIGYWAFDDGSGTTARDSSGQGNNGTLVNGPVWVDGNIGKALEFDGVDDYVQIPHNPGLIPTTGKATVSVWINAKRHTGPGGGTWQGILAKGGAPRLYNLYTHANKVIHFSTGASGAYMGSVSTGEVPLNEWVHVAVVVDDRHLYYLNGEPAGVAAEGAAVPTGGTSDLTIGLTTSGEANYFLGLIDEVRLYDLPLTPEQVKALYDGNPPSWPKAKDPDPPDGAPGVLSPLLEWKAGDGAMFHDVYFGASPDLTEADLVSSRQMFTMYWHVPGTESGVTYYWRVDEIEADGVTVHTGDVWSFTAIPVKAYAPSPSDGARNVYRDAPLAWLPTPGTVSHDVYLGTSRDDVAAGTGDTFKGNQPDATFVPELLDGDAMYYWRIDEVAPDGSKSPGEIWSFRTLPAFTISDPNLVGWWKLDEVSGTFVMDSSGYGNHGELEGDPQWVAGYDGGALEMDGVDDYAEIPHHETLTVDSEAAVMAWINPRNLDAQYQGIVAKGNAVRSYSLYLQSAGTLHFSTTSAGAYVGSGSTGTVTPNEWTHVCAMVVGGGHQYFMNGEPAGTGASGIVLPGDLDPATVRIGNTQESGRVFSGMIDDVRVYAAGLTREQLQEAMRGDPALAWGPQPQAGRIVDVQRAESLNWMPGDAAAEHDVYFGVDATAVADAGTGSPEYMGRQTNTSYPLDGLVEFGGGDYFWRVDEVAADGTTVHKGRIWTFTVADYLIVDDFEDYTDDEGNRIYEAWVDGWTNDTGSQVGYLQAPFAEQGTVHGGGQSMPLDYDNGAAPFYSEAEYTFAASQDWTTNGVDTLLLFVHGQATNGVGPVYVTIQDASNRTTRIVHPNAALATVGQWTEWRIPLSEFAGVNLARVETIYIGVGDRDNPTPNGSGILYIDDIQVLRPE